MKALRLLATAAMYLGLLNFSPRREILRDDRATMSFKSVGAIAFVVAAVVIGATVALIMLASLLPTYRDAVSDASNATDSAFWGSTVANSLAPTFALLISVGGLFAVVGLAFLAYNLIDKKT